MSNDILLTTDCAVHDSFATQVIFNTIALNGVTNITEKTNHENYPTRSLASYKVARRDGEKLVSSYYGKKEITIDGYIQADNQQQFESEIDFLKTQLTQKSGNLDITYNGIFRRYVATVESLQIARDSYNIDWAPFSIKFLVPDGKGYDVSQSIIDYHYVVTNVVQYNNVFQNVFNNEGTADAFPIITITVNSTDFIGWFGISDSVRILKTDAMTYVTGDVIVIDFSKSTVVRNGSQLDFSGAFPLFPAGATNFFFTIYGLDSDVSVSFNYTKAYL